MHYGCAIPFITVAAASLSQAMHAREHGLGPCAVPSLSEEDGAEFEWDRPMLVSTRARQALDFALEAAERFGATGQPIWPAEPSSFYGAFLRQDLGPVAALVVSYDASVHGWGAVARTRPDEPGRIFVGGYRQAVDLLGEAYLDPASLSETPAVQVYRETLAGLLAVRAVSQEFALGQYVVVVRGGLPRGAVGLSEGELSVATHAGRGSVLQPALHADGWQASAAAPRTRGDTDRGRGRCPVSGGCGGPHARLLHGQAAAVGYGRGGTARRSHHHRPLCHG